MGKVGTNGCGGCLPVTQQRTDVGGGESFLIYLLQEMGVVTGGVNILPQAWPLGLGKDLGGWRGDHS